MNRELCKLIRQTYGMTSAEFSEYIEVGLSSLQQYESGYSNSPLIPSKIEQNIPRSVIIEAEKLLRLTNAIKTEAAL